MLHITGPLVFSLFFAWTRFWKKFRVVGDIWRINTGVTSFLWHSRSTNYGSRKHVTTMGKFVTSDLMLVIIRWVTNIPSHSHKLEWTNSTQTTAHIATKIKMETERINFQVFLTNFKHWIRRRCGSWATASLFNVKTVIRGIRICIMIIRRLWVR